ncbi:MAG TPA: phosphoribosylamine--glycine ligase [Acidimicrobiales bacterium]|nr:phosphoribosylamine--glycine ligase [Acidimicrobiales bacterium]
MIVGVVGSGAREHAIASTLARTADVIVNPGNPGMPERSKEGYSIACVDTIPEELEVDLIIVGPEAPLVEGLADRLRARGVPVFGPGASGARLEGSKAFMKDLALRANVPSARYATFDDPVLADAFLATLEGGYVIKTDGLAAGKGVLVTRDIDEARQDVREKLSGASFGEAGRRVVIEEAMTGPEVSLLVLCANTDAVALPAAQDFKRVFDEDQGPNTGGMGAYSPVPVASDIVVGQIMDSIVHPTLRQLAMEGIDYRGVLYAGCMLTPEGPKLIEYNIRFGDPEAEVVLPRITSDFAELCLRVANGERLTAPTISEETTVCVVLAAHGYPGTSRSGDRIEGLEKAGTVKGVKVFHAGTRRDGEGHIVTAGGRVLCVSARGEDLVRARERAYEATSLISFDGAQFRHDIAALAAQVSLGTRQGS